MALALSLPHPETAGDATGTKHLFSTLLPPKALGLGFKKTCELNFFLLFGTVLNSHVRGPDPGAF